MASTLDLFLDTPECAPARLPARVACLSDLCAADYPLPGAPTDLHVCPLSGGADSTALAILLRHLFPTTPFRYVFFDTMAEPDEVYDTLVRLEDWLGQPIERIVPVEGGLWGLIERWNGFLPNQRDRYCTKKLKLEPMLPWLQSIRGNATAVRCYIGLHYDEYERTGLQRTGALAHADWLHQEYPFRSMRLARDSIFRILDQTIGIPGFYRWKSRSGCSCCFNLRASELIGALDASPAQFARAEAVEYNKLAPRDHGRFPVPPSIARDTGITPNHYGFPIPRDIDLRTSATPHKVDWVRLPQTPPAADLFESDSPQEAMTIIFAGVEFFVHPGVGDHGVWWQSLVSYSRTLTGLTSQLDRHYQERLQKASVFGLSPEDMKDELRLAVYQIALPSRVLDLKPLSRGSYTFKQGIAYRQLRHAIGWITRSLHAQAIAQVLQGCDHDSEAAESWRAAHSSIPEVGRVLRMARYFPKQPIIGNERESETPCFACSI